MLERAALFALEVWLALSSVSVGEEGFGGELLSFRSLLLSRRLSFSLSLSLLLVSLSPP